MGDWLIVGARIVMPLVAAWLARCRGRSWVGWFCLVLIFSFYGLLLLMALPRLRLTCPQCASAYRRGAAVCTSCGAVLPEPWMADRLEQGVR
jgi:hypothetical protein